MLEYKERDRFMNSLELLDPELKQNILNQENKRDRKVEVIKNKEERHLINIIKNKVNHISTFSPLFVLDKIRYELKKGRTEEEMINKELQEKEMENFENIFYFLDTISKKEIIQELTVDELLELVIYIYNNGKVDLMKSSLLYLSFMKNFEVEERIYFKPTEKLLLPIFKFDNVLTKEDVQLIRFFDEDLLTLDNIKLTAR